MTKLEILDTLIGKLLAEHPHDAITIPPALEEKQRLFRSLVNIRPAKPIDDAFLCMQDEYLQAEIKAKGITDAGDLPTIPGSPLLSVWQGDITTLKADAIVNAANSAMLGCFVPNHSCIDNAIHTYAGVQLRLACDTLMKKQGHDEPTGTSKITKAYNLPSRYVIHTVGPIISGRLTEQNCDLLATSYHSCLTLALEHRLASIAFCCISTGEFHFPQDKAAVIAVNTVKNFLQEHAAQMKVIFNVFQESDHTIYRRLFAGN